MRKHRFSKFFAVVALPLMAVLVSCSKDDTETEAPMIQVEGESSVTLDFPSAGESSDMVKTVNLTTNRSWSLSVSNNNPQWVTVTPSSGDGDQTLTIGVEPNTGNARTATITIKLTGGSSRQATIVVNQRVSGQAEAEKTYKTIADVRALFPTNFTSRTYYDLDSICKANNVTEEFWIKGTVFNDPTTLNNGLKDGGVLITDGADKGICISFKKDYTPTIKQGDVLSVKVNGASKDIVNYDGLLQLGTYQSDQTDVWAVIDSNQPIEWKETTIAEINSGKFDVAPIKLPAVQFKSSDLSKTFVVNGQSTSLTMENAEGESLTLRTQSSATFGSQAVPQGSGVFTGIAQNYRYASGDMAYQVYAANADSWAGMTNERFQIEVPDAQAVSIAQAREEIEAEIAAGKSNFSKSYKITGTVISDEAGHNVESNAFIIQDAQTANSGVLISIYNVGTATHTYVPGDQVEVTLTNAKISYYGGLLQVYPADEAYHKKVGSGTMPEPVKITAAQLADYESMYVEVNGQPQALFVGQPWNSTALADKPGTVLFTDDAGTTFTIYTKKAAVFKDDLVPQKKGYIRGIGSVYEEALQVMPRNAADLAGLTEDFTLDKYVVLTSAATVNVSGSGDNSTITFLSNTTWTAEVVSGSTATATVNPATGSNDGSVTVSFEANSDTENTKTATVRITGDGVTTPIEVVFTQAAGLPDGVKEGKLTNAEIAAVGTKQTQYKQSTVPSTSGDWTGIFIPYSNGDDIYLQFRAKTSGGNASYVKSPVFSGNVRSVTIRTNAKIYTPKNFYIMPGDFTMPATNGDYTENTFAGYLGKSAAIQSGVATDYTIELTGDVTQFIIGTVGGTAYIDSITVLYE